MSESKSIQANKNIEILIDKIIALTVYKDSGYCPYSEEKFNNPEFCNNKKCEDCTNKFYKDMKKELLNKYKV